MRYLSVLINHFSFNVGFWGFGVLGFVSRGKISDDPVEFVFKDGVSYLVVFSMFLINTVVVWG